MTPRHLAALQLTADLPPTPKNLDRAAATLGDIALARWAFAQWALRQRAGAKFADADGLFFEREGLEQATHDRVAAWHSAQFPSGAVVVDLTTGLGADLMALAARGPAHGLELDPDRAALARANLAARQLTAEVEVGDALVWLETDAGRAAPYLWADPARRVEGRRTVNPNLFAPNPTILAAAFAGRRRAGIKLSPLMADPELEALGEGLEFVSFRGECREAVVWRGSEVAPGRRAVHVESGEALDSAPPPAAANAAEAWVFEADPAAIRAHATGTLAATFGLRGLGTSPGYLTGGGLVVSPWLAAFRCLTDLPFDRKRVRAALRELGRRPEAVKLRGVRVDVARVQHEVDPGPMAPAPPVVLMLVPLDAGVRCLILERAPSPTSAN